MTIQDISLRKLTGSKGGSVKNTPDNLFSTDVVEALIAISEGPIKGLVRGARGYYVGETTLQDEEGNNNFDNFELVDYRGNEQGENIHSRLGGFGSSTNVGTQMATGVPIIRSGRLTDIDYLDVRFVINQLYKSTKKGTFESTGRWKIEYKAASASAWTPVRIPAKNPLPPQISGDDFDAFYGDTGEDDKKKKNVAPSPGDRPTFLSIVQPVTTANLGIWFDSNGQYKPKTFDGTTWAFPNALVWSASASTWSWREKSSWGKDKTTTAFVGDKLAKSFKFEQGDYWVDTKLSRVLFHNGSTWVAAGSTLRPGTFGEESGAGGTIELEDGEIAIMDKTTTPFVKEFRIPVKRIKEPYMIRTVKVSDPDNTERFFDITFESFQEVTAKDYKFPGLAVTQVVARASEQFSSLPDLSGIYDGRIIRVPKNYDPVARTYDGVWDGTWKMAYTDNPAFVANDIVFNDRYGMNAYYPITLNKWDVYDAGVWCDTRTAKGKPRFTFNALLADPKGGRDTLNYICGIFAGRFFDDGNGTGVIKIDKDGSNAALFTPEKVVDGVFTYSFTEISTRHNDLSVTFTNPELNWQEDRRRVYDQDHIDKYGRIPFNFEAVGCTDVDEAIVRARYHLITGISETMMVNFRTNRAGRYLSPYDVILVADEDMEMGLHGRVKSVIDSRRLELRDPIYLEPGFNYQVKFQLISPATQDFVIETRTLNGDRGAVTNLVTTSNLPALPDDAVFTIEQTNGAAAPVAFRVMNIKPVDGDPDNIEIQAMEMNRAKWLYVDGYFDSIDDLEEKALKTKLRPEPVPAIRVAVASSKQKGKTSYDLRLDWDASPSKFVSRYRILASRNNEPMATLAETDNRNFTWTDVATGEYVFQVIAINSFGKESRAKSIEHRFIGDFRVVEPITAVKMVGEKDSTIFESASPRFEWRAIDDPDHDTYVVQIRKGDGAIVREETTKGLTYQYDFADNAADNGGAIRTFTVAVASRDRYGFLSEFQTLTVTNPAPDAPARFTVKKTASGTIVVAAKSFGEKDITGFVVHMAYVTGFVPAEGNIVFEGQGGNATIVPPMTGVSYYLRGAFRDDFSSMDLNYSNEASIEIPALSSFDETPPEVPTGLDATSEILSNGMARFTAFWNANTEKDLASYDVHIKEGNGNYVSFLTATATKDWTVLPGTKLTVKLRALDNSGNSSGFTEPREFTAAVDRVPPAVPTGLAVVGTFASTVLKWNRNTEQDLAFYEVYEATTTAAPVAETEATFRSLGEYAIRSDLAAGTNFHYWLRAVDTSGNRSAWTARVSAATLTLAGTQPKPATPVAPTATSAVEVQAGGGSMSRVKVVVTASADAVSYEIGITRAGAAEVVAAVAATTYDFLAFPNVDYTIRVRAVSALGERSDFGQALVHKTARDTVAPAPATITKISSGLDSMWLTFSANADADFDHYEVLEGTTNNSATATVVGTATSTSFSITGLPNTSKRYYWVRTVDTSGNKSALSASTTATTGSLPSLDKVTLNGIVFTADPASSILSWTAGSISYGPVGAEPVTRLIGAGTAPYAEFGSTVYVYYGKPNTALSMTTSLAEVYSSADYTLLGVYKGGSDFQRGDGQVITDGATILAGTIGSAQLVTNEAVITGGAQIKSAIITDGHIVSLSAVKLQAGTALAGSITVAGTALSTVNSNAALGAQNPATRINGGTTQIDPGKIVISGPTTLADWRGLSDTTTINGGKIETASVSTRSIAVGNFQNMFQDEMFTNMNVWQVFGSATFTRYSGPEGSGIRIVKTTDTGESSIRPLGYGSTDPKDYVSVVPGDKIRVKAKVTRKGGAIGGNVGIYANVLSSDNVSTGVSMGSTANAATVIGVTAQISTVFTIPDGVVAIQFRPYYGSNANSANGDVLITDISIQRMSSGEMVVAGAITAEHLISDGAVITGTAQIANAIITDAHITGTLNAAKIRAGTVLAAGVLIGGQTLGDVQSWATNPAARVNTAGTKIDPGMITISGSTTLANWRSGSDTTKIDGGNIQANTISTNLLKVGSRGLYIYGVDFKVEDGQLSWTAGTVSYVGDDGATDNIAVAARTISFDGVTGVYFGKGSGTLAVRNLSSGGWNNLVANDNYVLLCTWWGGTSFAANYGGTIIDGSRIVTQSIKSAQIAAGAIKATHIAVDNLSALNIKVANADIDNLTISGVKLQDGAITDVYTNRTNTAVAVNGLRTVLSRTISLAANQRLLITAAWNLRTVMRVTQEIIWFANASIRVDNTDLDTTRVVGPGIDNYACAVGSMSATYVSGDAAETVTVKLVMDVGTGGSQRRNTMDEGLFTNYTTALTNDSTHMNILRGKK